MPGAKLEQFKALVEPHLKRLYRTACRLTGNAADAEDLVQDSCVRAWEGLPEPLDPERLERWLLRVLYHRFVDGARRKRLAHVETLASADEPEIEVASPAPGPEELAQQADTERELDAAWSKLERTQRVLLSLRAEGYGLAEIEAITGIGKEVLRARLHRARCALARHLADGQSELEAGNRVGRVR